MSDLISTLNWRYAAKRMNGNIVPREKLDVILQAIQLSPSSVGLQPYNVIVIDNQELKEKIFEVANKQAQILESSHILVFAAWENLTAEKITAYMELIASTRNVPIESLAAFNSSIHNALLARSDEANFQWAARQAYIALGYAAVAAATEHVDATPMEGFNGPALDELLGLNEKGLKSVLIMPLGYRDEEKDPLAAARKVRRPYEELFMTV